MPRLTLAVLMFAATLSLTGCKSDEERAEEYYQSGLALIEAGDVDRALVEFRNVFKYNGFHLQARQLYADTQLARGEVTEAYSQYLRLIEQYPDTVPVRVTLGQIAISRGDWEEAERHGQAAIALAPDQPDVQVIAAALDYRTATLANDAAGMADAVARARAGLDALPDNQTARRILIDDALQGADPQSALPLLDAAIAQEPGVLEFQIVKFQLLQTAGDTAASGTQLEAMFAQFPENQEVRTALIAWYMSQQDFDGAEKVLRELAGADTAAPEGHVVLIQFLRAARDADTALAEINRLIAANDGQPDPGPVNAELYRALKAGLDFEAGRQDVAIADLQAVLAKAQPSDQTRRIKLILAQMLVASDNPVGARALVEEVIVEDTTNVEALKMRAIWLIADDRPDAAINDLRAALGQAPRDAAVLTLMAEAHERAGSPDLAGENLSMAVEVSGSAPEPSLRYARFLLRDGRTQAAESVLLDARAANPANLDVLAQLAQMWLGAQDWTRAQELLDTVSTIDSPEARDMARSLQTALLMGQDRTEDSLAFLESQIGQGDDDVQATAMIVVTQARSGQLDAARVTLAAALTTTPDDIRLRLLSASIDALDGKLDTAEATLREVIAAEPAQEEPVKILYRLLASTGRAADAAAVVDAGIAAQPDAVELPLIKAGLLEQAGDIDAAIAIHEALYARDTSNVIFANNLASMIATHRDDAASLERAFAVARRLSGMEVPAFQDTYGWIEYRRGNFAQALPDLEAAAIGLPDDPLVQFHLGMTYVALNRPADAAPVLTRALDLAGDSPLPQFQIARDALAALPAVPAEQP